jgi:short subunit dehydrogenase-like uncharacterized protein
MTHNILLYGATGYSGRLVAAEGKAEGMSAENGQGNCRMILAARDGAQLRVVAKKNGMEFRVFGLDYRNEILDGLDGIDVVINAAGPFAFTAEPLAKAALEMPCHYVDINGEVDVYRKLDDLGFIAEKRGVAMVSGAGTLAAASDVLLDVALNHLFPENEVKDRELGAIRIAVSQIGDYSRGSAAAMMRSLREQVIVIRKRPAADGAKELELAIYHEPVGKLERMFDFGDQPDEREDQKNKHKCEKRRNLRIATAANLVDTLTAKHTILRKNVMVHSIESYVQLGTLGRMAYQLGGMFSSFSAVPWVRPIVESQLSLLPEGPTQQELEKKHVVLLEIEDVYHQRLIDWRWETPNVYQFTAQLVVEVARKVAEGRKRGWVTPAGAWGLMGPQDLADGPSQLFHPFRGCKLEQRELEERGS